MNSPKDKRGVNYKAVQNWTRKVDLFSYDYVVVPINEAAHWYVAIICNLQSLLSSAQKEPESSQPNDGDEASPQIVEFPAMPEPTVVEEKPRPDQGSFSGKEEMTRESFSAMNLSDQSVGVEMEKKEDITREELPNDSDNSKPFIFPRTTRNSMQGGVERKGQPRGKRKTRSSGWIDPSRPTIITFDSLDLSRQPTIRTLKEYLYEEAKSKRDTEIDTSLMRGIKARAIPLQRNYSDCGLYLLAYIEKFVRNPDYLISKLLQKETTASIGWPVLRSDLLRRRLRSFLDELYEEQEQIRRGEKSGDRDTLADRKEICFLLGSRESEDTGQEEAEDPGQNSKGYETKNNGDEGQKIDNDDAGQDRERETKGEEIDDDDPGRDQGRPGERSDDADKVQQVDTSQDREEKIKTKKIDDDHPGQDPGQPGERTDADKMLKIDDDDEDDDSDDDQPLLSSIHGKQSGGDGDAERERDLSSRENVARENNEGSELKEAREAPSSSMLLNSTDDIEGEVAEVELSREG